MANPMDKPGQQNPQNPQQAQTPQKNPGQGQAQQGQPGQKAREPGQKDPSQRDQSQQGKPQDRYASGTDRARDMPDDRKGGQDKPGSGRDDDQSGKH